MAIGEWMAVDVQSAKHVASAWIKIDCKNERSQPSI